ncbi:MAG: PEGA domain-containing protein [Pseudomonadota bacterium]
MLRAFCHMLFLSLFGQFLWISATAAPDPASQRQSATEPASSLADAPKTHAFPTDPFAKLTTVIPKDALPFLNTIRLRPPLEQNPRNEKISIVVNTIPNGATVKYGGRTLGKTPLTLYAPKNSTPLDLVIRHAGYMTLRTRIHRRTTYTYSFKLNPAKLH